MATSVDANAIRAARERAGLTQEELARSVGVFGGERVSRWERGVSEPRPEFLVRLAKALRLDAAQLLHLEPDHEPDLRALRMIAGLSVREAAARVHVSEPSYKRWEAGLIVRAPTARNLTALARVFDVPIETVHAATSAAGSQRRGADQPASSAPDA